MPCCTGSVGSGTNAYGFVNYRHSGSVKFWARKEQKQLNFFVNAEVFERGSVRLCLAKAMRVEGTGNVENHLWIGIEDPGNDARESLLGRSVHANRLARSESNRPENGSAVPVARKQSNLLTIAVDIDEVLGSFLNSLNAFIAEKYLVHYDLSEYYVYDFMKIWKCSQAEANHRVHAFFDSKHFNSGILPIRGALQSLSRLSSYCNLVVVTSRQHVIRGPSLEWISMHYRGIFSEVHFGNHFALEGEARPKSEICKSLGVQFLIDDNPRYAVECANEGIEVLLFDLDYSYPWSRTPDGPSHPLITRVCNWQEVELKLMALFPLHCGFN